MFDTINGLPVHVLVVHFVVVLIPLTSLGAILVACVPRWSRRFGVLVCIGGLVSLAAAVVAQESGEQFAQRVGTPAEHMELGLQVKWYAFGLFAVTLVLWLLDRKSQKRSTAAVIFAVLCVIAAVLATWSTYRTGESGSQAVWEFVIKGTKPPTG